MSKDKDSRIHSWDRAAFLRALLWSVAIEGLIVGLSALWYDEGTGPPHSFPRNPIVLLYILYHLPSILVSGLVGAGSTFVVVFQTVLVTYLLFVWIRLKKIKVRLY
jgi:hypothetical protein